MPALPRFYSPKSKELWKVHCSLSGINPNQLNAERVIVVLPRDSKNIRKLRTIDLILCEALEISNLRTENIHNIYPFPG
jgi:hypothetical protein